MNEIKDVTEKIKAHSGLEEEIARLINEFESNTGVKVSDISVNRQTVHGGVDVWVKLVI